MTDDVVRTWREGPVGWLQLNRPRAGNAMDAEMMALLPRAWRALDDDDDVRCIALTGAGKAFQTGLDVAALANAPESLRESSRRTRTATLQLTGWHLNVRTPVITAVNGMCAGGGLHFVLDSDVVVASSRASFIDPHVSVGQASSWEAVGLMVRTPATFASRMALVGRHERVSADLAYRMGLVGEVVEPELLLQRAQTLGEAIADRPPATVRALKQSLWASLEVSRHSAADLARLVATTLEENQ